MISSFQSLLTMGIVVFGSSLAYATSATPAAALRTSKRAILELKPGVEASSVVRKLPAGWKKIEADGFLLVVEANHPLTESDLLFLKKTPGVLTVGKVSTVRPRINGSGETSAPVCSPTDGAKLSAPGVAAVIAAVSDPSSCGLAQICANSKRPKLWAQEKMSGDLMAAEVARVAPPSASSDSFSGANKIAVIDTGFDIAGLKNLMANPALNVEAGSSEIGTLNEDEYGHGSLVASLIGGKSGIGISPSSEITVYKTQKAGESTMDDSAIFLSLKKACDAGNKIINVSAGVSTEERTGKELLDDKPELADYLASQGCLVIFAVGNDGFQFPVNNSDSVTDRLYLRVGASDQMGGRADLSDTAELYAPGAPVFGLQSQHPSAEVHAATGDMCGTDGKSGFEYGTSLSAPLVSAVASSVEQILASGSEYTKLNGPDRFALINQVLSASARDSQDQTVNGLRAVKIAEAFKDKDFPTDPIGRALDITDLVHSGMGNPTALAHKIPGVSELRASLDAICRTPAPKSSCATTGDCGSLKSCMNEERSLAAICPGRYPDVERDLMKVTLSEGDLELASQYVADLGPKAVGVWTEAELLNSVQADSHDQNVDVSRLISFYGNYKKATGQSFASVDTSLQKLAITHALAVGSNFTLTSLRAAGLLPSALMSSTIVQAKNNGVAAGAAFIAVTKVDPPFSDQADLYKQAYLSVKAVTPPDDFPQLLAQTFQSSNHLPPDAGAELADALRASKISGETLSSVEDCLTLSRVPLPGASQVVQAILDSKAGDAEVSNENLAEAWSSGVSAGIRDDGVLNHFVDHPKMTGALLLDFARDLTPDVSVFSRIIASSKSNEALLNWVGWDLLRADRPSAYSSSDVVQLLKDVLQSPIASSRTADSVILGLPKASLTVAEKSQLLKAVIDSGKASPAMVQSGLDSQKNGFAPQN